MSGGRTYCYGQVFSRLVLSSTIVGRGTYGGATTGCMLSRCVKENAGETDANLFRSERI